MIYVYQDSKKIPKGWLAKVKTLKAKLETLPTAAERAAFIDKN